MEYDIDQLVGQLDFSSNELQVIGKNIMLTNHEIEVLERYKIEYTRCNSLKEILFEVEDMISDMDDVDEELEAISQSISERDYYQNTNK